MKVCLLEEYKILLKYQSRGMPAGELLLLLEYRTVEGLFLIVTVTTALQTCFFLHVATKLFQT
jgi:hypothetical protein